MKKVDLIRRVLQSINHPIVRQVPGREKGKPVMRDVTVSSLDELLARVQSLVLQASSVSADADGYASTTPGNGSPGGGKGGGRLMKIEDDLVPTTFDLVPTTSTEAAALLGHRGGGDPLSKLAAKAWARLQEIAHQVHELELLVSDADRLQSRSKVAEVRMCAVATMLGLDWADEWSVREGMGARLTDFAGQLAEPLGEKQLVCKYVYWFVYNHKRLPVRGELEAYLASRSRR